MGSELRRRFEALDEYVLISGKPYPLFRTGSVKSFMHKSTLILYNPMDGPIYTKEVIQERYPEWLI